MKTDVTPVKITYPSHTRAFSELGWAEQCNRIEHDAQLLAPDWHVKRILAYLPNPDPNGLAKDFLTLADALQCLADKLKHMADVLKDDPSVLSEGDAS